MALPFIGTGTTTTGAAGAGTTIAGATASTILAGAGIGISALAATQGLYDTFANPDGVVYGEDGQIRDYTRSAKIGAWLTGSQLTPIENLAYTPLKASSNNAELTQLRQQLGTTTDAEKQLALLTKFFATAEGKQLLAANGLPDSTDKLGAEIQGMLYSGKSTEEIFQHFLAVKKRTPTPGTPGTPATPTPPTPATPATPTPGTPATPTPGTPPTPATPTPATPATPTPATPAGGGEKPPKWKESLIAILTTLVLHPITTGITGTVIGVGGMKIYKDAEDEKEFKKLQGARLSSSITKVRNAYVALKAQKTLSPEVTEGLNLIAPRLKSLQTRFNMWGEDREIKDGPYYQECKAVYNLLTLLLQKHNQQNPNSPFNEITAFMSIETIIDLKANPPQDIDTQLIEAKKPFQKDGAYVGEWS